MSCRRRVSPPSEFADTYLVGRETRPLQNRPIPSSTTTSDLSAHYGFPQRWSPEKYRKIVIDNHVTICYNLFIRTREVMTMNWILPGTVIPARREEADKTCDLFQSMFLPGGMVLGQVSNISGLEPYMIQNWVKRGFLAPPRGKRYTLRQLCRILNINMLRGALPMEKICGLLTYVSGHLDDESDDLIDDSRLYFMFVRLAARARRLDDKDELRQALDQVLSDYEEPVPGAKLRIEKVLRVMLTAWISTRMRQEAEKMLSDMESGAQET